MQIRKTGVHSLSVAQFSSVYSSIGVTIPSITTLPTRSEVPLEQTWVLESIFATHTDWKPACRALIAPELVEAVFQVLAPRGRNANAASDRGKKNASCRQQTGGS
jgi:hypothetical protein